MRRLVGTLGPLAALALWLAPGLLAIELFTTGQLGGLRFSAVSPGAAAQFFTRRWWVLGMRMSSRYLATVRRVT